MKVYRHQPWGKLGSEGIHPLCDHMLDVAACFKAIIATKSIRRALEKLAGRSLDEIDIQRLAALVFLHDIGKANAGFQAKFWVANKKPIPEFWPRPTGHSSEALYIFENPKLIELLPIYEMSNWGENCLSLLRASISHHGRPVINPLDPGGQRMIWAPVKKSGEVLYDPTCILKEIGQKTIEWFPEAFLPGQPLPQNAQFEHLFAGLVQFADWLGSDKTFFPYSVPGEDRYETVWQRGREAVERIGIDASKFRAALPENLNFSKVFNVSNPRPIQEKMGDSALGPLLILESETGSGKTEAAFWRFANLYQQGKVDGLYFALPTRVAATQLYERTRHFATGLWKESGQTPPVVVRALAGYENADGHDVIKLPEFKVLWADNPEDQVAHTRWAAESSKRFLAAPIAVGTIDQALLAVLQVRHAHMRNGLLSRSLLVVDEVHASDAYMATLLEHLLNAHLKAGGHALLLSATLGSSARHRYQRLISPDVPMPTLAQATDLPYPALTDGTVVNALPDSGRSKRVHWQVKNCIDSPDDIAAMAIDAARQGAKVLVIRNTVPTALATFRAVESVAQKNGLQEALFNLNGIATVHHSRYSREDRPMLDKAVEQQIGKERAKPLQACIVVGTQTLEQSLDIDADLLITDLCPMDVLLQRVGRLHRHDRKPEERPESYRQAQAVVLVPNDHSLEACLKKSRHGLGRFHNGGGIYIDLRILEATRRLISGADSHLIPQDNRGLVERATHPEVLAELEKELGADWMAHGLDILGDVMAATVQGKHNVLDFRKHFWEIDESGYEVDAYCFTGIEQHISSRIGAGDYLLSFDPPQRSPFGIKEVRRIPVSPRMWPNELPPETLPVIQATETDGTFIFTLGATTYRYSRLGLERISDKADGVNP